jgi:hypothetical protein
MSSGSGPLFLGPEVANWQTAAVVAQPSQPNDGGGQGEDFGKSSPVGLLVLLLFFIAVAFLVRSMTKHLKRVPASFDEPGDEPGDRPDGEEPAPESSEEPPASTADAAEEKPVDESAEKK